MKLNCIPTQYDSSLNQPRARTSWKTLSQQEELHRNTGTGWRSGASGASRPAAPRPPPTEGRPSCRPSTTSLRRLIFVVYCLISAVFVLSRHRRLSLSLRPSIKPSSSSSPLTPTTPTTHVQTIQSRVASANDISVLWNHLVVGFIYFIFLNWPKINFEISSHAFLNVNNLTLFSRWTFSSCSTSAPLKA